ncbi:MAG: NAD(P)-dependent alcohol dehydrogenase [Acidimicrobiales bacterium]
MTQQLSSTMRAATQRAYGSSELLQLETIDRPIVGPGEVLIEVVAAGLDRGVWHLMHGLPYLMRILGFGFRRPKQPVPGLDVAGRVVSVGPDVERFAVGDEVFGVGRGTFAEYAVAEEGKLVAKPASVPFEQAAVTAISGMTAHEALVRVGRVEAGQHVLVIGASGGVGSFAVQLAKALGATVTGVARGAKHDAVRRLGADHVIDYTVTEIDAGDTRYDLIIDTGGQPVVAAAAGPHSDGNPGHRRRGGTADVSPGVSDASSEPPWSRPSFAND